MHREVLKLSIPNILSNISVPLISTVDTALMGHLSSAHLGAVGIGAMIFNFIYWNFGFLRMGVTGMTAQAYGRENREEQVHLLLRAVFIALCIASFLLILMVPIEYISINAMNVDPTNASLVSEYFRIRIIAAPASLLIYVIVGWFLGMQNAIFPLLITLFVNVVNAGISIYLVKYLNMSIAGVAWGTVLAQYIGLVFALLLYLSRYKSLLYDAKTNMILQWESLRKFIKINTDIFFRTICLTLSFAFVYSQSSTQGELILAVNVILLQLLNWMSYGIDGFAFSAESMVGKYKGAQDESRTYQSIRLAFIWGGVLAVIYSLVFGLGYVSIIQLFTNDVAVIEKAQEFRIWMAIFPIIAFGCYIWDGVFIGLTAVKAMRNTMFFSFIIFILSYYVLRNIAPEKSIWLALMLFLFVRGVSQSYIFARKNLNIT